MKNTVLYKFLKKTKNIIKFKLATIMCPINIKIHEKMFKKNKVKIISDVETVDKILFDGKSLARFGDGELSMIINKNFNIGFQVSDDKLKERLRDIIVNYSDDSNVLLGLPSSINPNNYNKYKKNVRIFWADFYRKNYKKILNLIDNKNDFSDNLITRCYMDYVDKSDVGNKYNNLKRIWDNKEIVIIEGEKTKIGIGNDLLSNAKSIERIICPSKNAFLAYDKILASAIKHCKNKITLIALGPTATVLAYDLSCLNKQKCIYQAIDVGHLDVEYEWFKSGSDEKVALKGKAVNEVTTFDLSQENIENGEYLKQIIDSIK